MTPISPTLRGLHAILRLYAVQGDETYLSLVAGTEALAQDGLRQAQSRR